MKDRVQVAINIGGVAREESLMGVSYRVYPATLVKSKVLNNNLGAVFLPPEEITQEWADIANGSPVVVDHPTRRGAPVTARDPKVLNGRGAGYLYEVKAENNALVGEVWLDTKSPERLPSMQGVFNKLDAGETVELSTGFPVALMAEAGTADGVAYNGIIRPRGFDHLAIFADTQVGACSVKDGCGLAANHEGECLEVPEPPAVSPEQVANDSRWTALLKGAARFLGFSRADNESAEDRKELLRTALVEKFGGEGIYLWIVATYPDEGFLVYEREAKDDAGYFQVDYEVSEDGAVTLSEPVAVRRVTAFEPVTNT